MVTPGAVPRRGDAMNASAWIAAISAFVAALAFAASRSALKLQRVQAQDSIRQEFDDIIHQLGSALGRITPDAQPGGPGAESRPASAAVGELQTLVLRADEMLHPDLPPAPAQGWRRLIFRRDPHAVPPTPSWYDILIMAYAFTQVWDMKRAESYWRAAAAIADKDPGIGSHAQINTLRSIGSFYYSKNHDLAAARASFDQAMTILKPDIDGPELTHDGNYLTRFIQAQAEDQVGNTAQAAENLRLAWAESIQVQATWRRQRATAQIVGMIVNGGDPGRFGAHGGLPQEIMEEVGRLQALQQAPNAQQQMLAAAWDQGYIAAQQQMFAAQHPTMSQQPPGGHTRGARFPAAPRPPQAPAPPDGGAETSPSAPYLY
jgi:hypothetical protein